MKKLVQISIKKIRINKYTQYIDWAKVMDEFDSYKVILPSIIEKCYSEGERIERG